MFDVLLGFVKKRFVVYMVVVLGVVLSFVSFSYSYSALQEKEQMRFESVANQVTTLIKTRMDGYRQILYAGVGLFESSDDVTRQEWQTFVESLRIDENYRGIQGIGYAQVLHPHELASHIKTIRAEGFSDYTVHPKGERELYVPIVYLEPFTPRNQRAFGFDMFSEEVRRAAMTQAYLTQKAVTSDKVRLLQENSIDEQAGFLMYVPLYTKKIPNATPQQLLESLEGFVYAPFRAKDLMQGVLGERYDTLSLEIYEGNQIDERKLLHRERDVSQAVPFSVVQHIRLDGRDWTLRYVPKSSFFAEVRHDIPWLILAFGLVVTMTLFALMMTLVRIKEQAQMIANQMTQKLSASEERMRFALLGSGDGIWDWNIVDGTLIFSKRWKEMLGYSEEEIGNQLSEWERRIHPDDLTQTRKAVQEHFEEKSLSYTNEHRMLCKDGSYKWILDRGIVVERDDEGNPLRMVGSHFDVSLEKEAKEKIREANERFELVVRGTNDGVWSWDLRTNHLYMSARWKEMLGYSDDELSSEFGSFVRLVYEEDQTRVNTHIQSYLEGTTKRYETEYRMRHKNGSVVWILAKGEALRDAQGRAYLMAGTNSDITHRKKAQEQLEIAKEEAESANRSKGQFLANMSHEIRTPMNAILGLSQMLLDGELGGKERDWANKILSSSKMLLGIINDVLDYSKIEADKLELEHKSFELENIWTQQRVLFSQNGLNQGVELYFWPKAPLPLVIEADELRLDQVLSNLLSNALKFTHHGTVVLTVETLERFENRALLEFSVSDSGIGMDIQEQERLFKPFTQADSSTTRKYGGTGLGLVIAGKIVGAMGGRLKVESDKGKGSRFSFTLDVPVISWDSPKTLHEEVKYRVLVVDDQKLSREILREMFEMSKCEVEEAANGQEALDKISAAHAQNRAFDTVLIDYKMPVMDGIETIWRLEAMVTSGHIAKLPAILLMSGYVINDVDVYALPIEGFLTKPITHSLLFDALMDLENGVIKQEEPQPSQVPDFSGLRILLVEDNRLNQEVATIMLERTGAIVTIANNGKEAVEIFQKASDHIDTILMDVQMPIMGGYEAAQLIRQGNKEIPIIALTAAALSEDRDKALEAGMNDHLGKPIDRALMYATIAKWSGRDFTPPVVTPSPVLPQAVLWDEAYALEIANQNPALLYRLIGQFVEQLEEEFGQLGARIERHDAKASALVHALKGVSGNLGAKQLSMLCTQIDALYKAHNTIDVALSRSLDESIRTLVSHLRSKIITHTSMAHIPLDESELKALLEETKEHLKKHTILPRLKIEQLASALMGHVDGHMLAQWQKNMDNFEYEKALTIMKEWRL